MQQSAYAYLLFFSVIGPFNICDKLLVALEILVHQRELFKRGVPLTTATESSLESWRKCGQVLSILQQHIRLQHSNVNFYCRLLCPRYLSYSLKKFTSLKTFYKHGKWQNIVCDYSLKIQPYVCENVITLFSLFLTGQCS